MSDLAMREALESLTLESAIGIVLGYFVDDTSLPEDIRVALTKIILSTRGTTEEEQ